MIKPCVIWDVKKVLWAIYFNTTVNSRFLETKIWQIVIKKLILHSEHFRFSSSWGTWDSYGGDDIFITPPVLQPPWFYIFIPDICMIYPRILISATVLTSFIDRLNLGKNVDLTAWYYNLKIKSNIYILTWLNHDHEKSMNIISSIKTHF